MRAQRCTEIGVPRLERAQAVVSGAPVQVSSALTAEKGLRHILALELVGILLNEGIGELGEAGRGSGKESRMLGRLLKQTLHELQAERCGRTNQLGIIVAGETRAARREGISEPIRRVVMH